MDDFDLRYDFNLVLVPLPFQLKLPQLLRNLMLLVNNNTSHPLLQLFFLGIPQKYTCSLQRKET